MNIFLKRLELKNFKGVKDLNVDFGKVTKISGDNGTGKTTIMDSFMWLLFGKDSKDRKDYKIKTIDDNGEELHGLEHTVIGILDVDGTLIKLQRTYKERWTKQKGQAKSELKGHTTDYSINDVPASMKEYNEKVNDILADNTFKLITNPLYFTSLDWKKQREILLQIIGDVDEENVINYNKSLKPLEKLLGDDGVEALRKQVKVKITKIKEQIKAIPNRIDECNLQIAEEDFEALEEKKKSIKAEMENINALMIDKSKVNEEKLKLQDQLYKLKNEYSDKLNQAKNTINSPLKELQSKLRDINYKVQDIELEIERAERKIFKANEGIGFSEESILEKEKEQEKLRIRFKEEKAKTFEFDEDAKYCPTCMREYDHERLDEIREDYKEKFESYKNTVINRIRTKGKALGEVIENIKLTIEEDKKLIKKYNDNLVELNSKIEILKTEGKEIEAKLSKCNVSQEVTFEGKEDLENKINLLIQEIENISAENDLELKAKYNSLSYKIDEINTQLGKKSNNERLVLRIKELEQEEKELAVKQAELEGQDFMCEEFIRTKVELLEGNINRKFNGLTFKLFDQQINGGLTETCEALIDGVPFTAANTASQINAGLQIINTLCEHYDVTAPIFVDNAESVNNLELCNSQLIKLIVTLDKKLKVEVID
ncbi:AAA family ATPase [Clostridium tertium]|uniref:AAA family ATPase n=1 Tax=Clostridium tertium TaxID=1559 RepID=UPI0024B348F6|nr:AAA family ATPase [Clostridium tertium]MDI9215978.1 AAA family ATPase [Clostridium tertium]